MSKKSSPLRLNAAALAGFAGLAIAIPAVGAGMPSVKITSPQAGATVTTTDIPVTVDVRDFNLETKYAGMPAKHGRGHLHVMVDGMDMAHLTNVSAAKTIKVSGEGLKAGEHKLMVMLASDDHAPASKPAMVTFNYQPAQEKPLPEGAEPGQPTVTILSPRNGERVGRKFTMRVALKNFHLSCAEGKENVPGYGHLHVMVSQPGMEMHGGSMDSMGGMKGSMGKTEGGMGDMKGMAMPGMVDMPCTDSFPVDLSAWQAGKTTIMVTLANNDHGMGVGAPPASITVNLK